MFSPSSKADLSDVERHVAVFNVKWLENAVETTLARFESSPNFRILDFENEWINHPDEYFVETGVFKNLFKNFFGDIYLQHFLTEYNFDKENMDKVRNFRASCDLLYSQLSYDEVECAFNKLANLHALLLKL